LECRTRRRALLSLLQERQRVVAVERSELVGGEPVDLQRSRSEAERSARPEHDL
jgi:hypothetical protein